MTVLHPSDNEDLSFISSSNCVLDPNYLVMEPSPREYANIILGRRLDVLVDTGSTISVWRLSNRELLRYYSIPDSLLTPAFDTLSHTYWFDDVM